MRIFLLILMILMPFSVLWVSEEDVAKIENYQKIAENFYEKWKDNVWDKYSQKILDIDPENVYAKGKLGLLEEKVVGETELSFEEGMELFMKEGYSKIDYYVYYYLWDRVGALWVFYGQYVIYWIVWIIAFIVFLKVSFPKKKKEVDPFKEIEDMV